MAKTEIFGARRRKIRTNDTYQQSRDSVNPC